jgi:NAD(P)-dependent dehydrogenase (short-subunit alcohol dehydrogenase family)
MFDLTGRVAAIVGGTSGIGKAISDGLARCGATSVAGGRRTGCDVRDRASVDAFRDGILALHGRIDILVNAAAYTFRKPTAQVSDAEWNDLMDTDLTGALRVCQSFYEPLKARGHGRIINIASLGSYLGFLEVSAYCAAKTAVLSLTRSLAVEWARDGILVNAIAPGVFPTELNASLIMGTPRGAEMLARTPMGRFGKPEELVGLAVLLASDASSFMTGQCIAVDGGYLASGVNQ